MLSQGKKRTLEEHQDGLQGEAEPAEENGGEAAEDEQPVTTDINQNDE